MNTADGTVSGHAEGYEGSLQVRAAKVQRTNVHAEQKNAGITCSGVAAAPRRRHLAKRAFCVNALHLCAHQHVCYIVDHPHTYICMHIPCAVQTFRSWLSTKGSPQSRISRAEITNERAIDSRTCEGFSIRR
jgi:hypothetical protein